MVSNQRTNEAFRNLILKKRCSAFYILLQSLVFINLIKHSMLLHVFQYVMSRKTLGVVCNCHPKQLLQK